MTDSGLQALKDRHEELLRAWSKKQKDEDMKKRNDLQRASLRASIKMLEEKLRGETSSTKTKTTSQTQVNVDKPKQTQVIIDKPKQTQVSVDEASQMQVSVDKPKQTENEPDAITGNGMFFSFKIDESSPTADMVKQIRNEIFKKIERGEI